MRYSFHLHNAQVRPAVRERLAELHAVAVRLWYVDWHERMSAGQRDVWAAALAAHSSDGTSFQVDHYLRSLGVCDELIPGDAKTVRAYLEPFADLDITPAGGVTLDMSGATCEEFEPRRVAGLFSYFLQPGAVLEARGESGGLGLADMQAFSLDGFGFWAPLTACWVPSAALADPTGLIARPTVLPLQFAR